MVEGALDQIHGTGVGTIHMPTPTELGILTVVGQSEQGRVFMLDAELTSAIPSLFDHHNRVAYGGLSGELSEAPLGGATSGQTFDGVVEGTWQMEKSLEGSYDALVYERSANDELELVGRITGLFRVNESNAGALGDSLDGKKEFETPFAPGDGPLVGDAVDGKKEFGTPFTPGDGPLVGDAVDSKKDFEPPFGRATEPLVRYGDDVIDVRIPKNVNGHLGDAASHGMDGAAVVGTGSFGVHDPAKEFELSGATKLQFKLLD